MNTLDVRIFGIEERMENILTLNNHLPGVTVVIDKNHDGIIPTSKKTWLIPTESTHVMVLNDDVLLCNDFYNICVTMINTHPKSIFTLFSFPYMDGSRINRCGGYPKKTPYVEVKSVGGAGIIMPREYIEPCISSWKPDAKHDDTSICEWAITNKIQILTPIPAILQHLPMPSTVGHPQMQTKIFEEFPVADWSCGFVLNESNVK